MAERNDRPGAKQSARCSFCGKGAREVCKLIVGPGVFICDACVRLAAKVAAQQATPSPAVRAPHKMPATRAEMRAVVDQGVDLVADGDAPDRDEPCAQLWRHRGRWQAQPADGATRPETREPG